MRRVNIRRRRHSRAGALAVLATLAAAAAVIAFGGSAAPALGGTTGAKPAGAPVPVAAQPAPAAQRACTPADVAVSVGGTGAFRGHATQELTITNNGSDACFLPGAPSTTLLFDDGSQQEAGQDEGATSRVDLAPGQTALVLVGTPGTCAGADESRSKVARRMVLGLPGGGSVHVQGTNLDAQCGQSTVLLVTGP